MNIFYIQNTLIIIDRKGIPITNKKSICFDWKCSFQNTSRKLAQIPSLAIVKHTRNYCSMYWIFCNCYENLDEKRNETISLWQQCSPSTWIDVGYYWMNNICNKLMFSSKLNFGWFSALLPELKNQRVLPFLFWKIYVVGPNLLWGDFNYCWF